MAEFDWACLLRRIAALSRAERVSFREYLVQVRAQEYLIIHRVVSWHFWSGRSPCCILCTLRLKKGKTEIKIIYNYFSSFCVRVNSYYLHAHCVLHDFHLAFGRHHTRRLRC